MIKLYNSVCHLFYVTSSLQALDTFNAAIVSPIYYVMFTTLTIAASAIMFKVDSLTNHRTSLSDIINIMFKVGRIMLMCYLRIGMVKMQAA